MPSLKFLKMVFIPWSGIGAFMWSIISNNCWAEPVYKQFQLGYNTPTIGLWFYAEDYINFLSDLRTMLTKPLRFIDNPRRGQLPYPVAELTDGVEIQFMHFKSEAEAREKWARRAARVPSNDDDLRIRICDRDGLTQNHIERFAALPFRYKTGFFKRGRFDLERYGWAIELDSEEETVTSGVAAYHQAVSKGFDVKRWLFPTANQQGKTMTFYEGLTGFLDHANEPHLGGSVRVGDPFTYCPSVWDYVVSRFSIASVLDIGSGSGNASNYFFNKGLKVVAVDGFTESVMKSVYPSIRHDLTQGPIVTKVDLVHCHEVVEHIEEQYLDNLLDSLACGKIILMTHAVPGQPGHHHVNCQPQEYWIEAMQRRNCVLANEDSRRVRELAGRDGAVFMRDTGMIFVNESRI